MKKNIYICPSCGLRVDISASRSKCGKCGFFIKSDKQGNVSFVNNSYYWGEIPPEKMKKVLAESRAKGWRKAVSDLTLHYPKMEEYLLNAARVDWIYHCLNKKRNNRVLDIGSGWGSLAFNLTNFFSEVYSLETVEARAEFQKIRKQQEKNNSLHVVRADFMKLPFEDNSFDLVVVNGVLEWVGIANKGNPKELQIKFLKEINRVLRPGGCLYIGIENRFGLHYLLGADDHSGLPFTSLLPRFIADLIVRNLRKTKGKYKLRIRTEQEWENYRTYTYSLSGYKSLLNQSGFRIIRPYWTLFYSNPKFSGLMDGDSFLLFLKLLSKNTSGDKISFGKIAAIIGSRLPNFILVNISKHLVPCYLLYAYKDNIDERVETQIVDNNSFLKVSGSGADDAKVNYFLINKDKVIIRKLSRFPQYDVATRKEELLGKKYGNLPLYAENKIGNIKVYSEKYVDAKRINPYNQVENRLVLEYLLEFQGRKAPLTAIAHPIDELISFTKNMQISTKKEILNHLEKLKILMKQSKVKTSMIHGDFCSMNILLDGDNKLYVLDWEDFEESGYVFEDFIFYMIHSLARKYSPKQIANLLCNTQKSIFLSDSLALFKKKYDFSDEMIMHGIYYVCIKNIRKFEELGGRHNGHRDFYLSLIKQL